jgi:hypothetical protein
VDWFASNRPGLQSVAHFEPAIVAREVPISLDAIFRLAETNNPRVAQVREKLAESLLVQEMNCRSWLPNTYAGLKLLPARGRYSKPGRNAPALEYGSDYSGVNIQTDLDAKQPSVNDQRNVWQSRADFDADQQ